MKKEMSNPLISVIVPVYRVEKYLHNCINSVLNQSYSNWELILVDDGSPDGCPQICDDYASRDKRIIVVHKKNGGLSDARNIGIKSSSGAFLVFVDSDDYWDDSLFLDGLANLILNNPAVDIINFGWKKYYPKQERFEEDLRDYSFEPQAEDSNEAVTKEMIRKDLFVACAWNKCVRSQFLIDNHLFFKKGIKSEDMEWCGSILYRMPTMLCFDRKPYVYRQQRMDSITATVDETHIKDIIFMIKDALVKSKNLDPKKKNIYLSFFALQFLTLLYNVYREPLRSKKNLMTETENLKNILVYDLNKKVKFANQIRKIVGYRLMARAMHFYISIKKV